MVQEKNLKPKEHFSSHFNAGGEANTIVFWLFSIFSNTENVVFHVGSLWGFCKSENQNYFKNKFWETEFIFVYHLVAPINSLKLNKKIGELQAFSSIIYKIN